MFRINWYKMFLYLKVLWRDWMDGLSCRCSWWNCRSMFYVSAIGLSVAIFSYVVTTDIVEGKSPDNVSELTGELSPSPLCRCMETSTFIKWVQVGKYFTPSTQPANIFYYIVTFNSSCFTVCINFLAKDHPGFYRRF